MTSLIETPTQTEPDFLGLLVASHGDISLVAERAYPSLSPKEAQLATLRAYARLNPADVRQAIANSVLIQTYQASAQVNVVVVNTLADLSPNSRAHLLTELLKQLAVMLTPPVQAASTNVNIVNQMTAEHDSVRDSLAKVIEQLPEAE